MIAATAGVGAPLPGCPRYGDRAIWDARSVSASYPYPLQGVLVAMPARADRRGQTINALLALKAETPADLVDEPMGFSPSGRAVDIYDVPSSAILHRGQVFWESIYGKVAKRVMGQMDRSGTEDLGLTARLMYGYLLSSTGILTQAETSFVLIAALIPQDVSLKVLLSGSFITPV